MKKIALLIAAAALTPAQTPNPEKRAEFEVASIRPAQDDGRHDADRDNSLYRIHNYTLKRLVSVAWEIDISQVSGGLNWMDSDSYDINARIPAALLSQARENLPRMLQSLLTDRFHLVVHSESREISGYALVTAKKEPKMERAKPDQEDSDVDSTGSHLTAQNVTMQAFARRLSRNRDVGKLVVDRTGLAGGFNFALDWMPYRPESGTEPPSDDHPSIFTALEEQLGLKLESAKVQAPVIVIDHAEWPDEN